MISETLADMARALHLGLEAALLDRSAFERIALEPGRAPAALIVPFLAGASELLGQGYVLASRRVSRWRALASLVMTGLVYVIAAVVWAVSAHLFLSLGRFEPEPELTLLGAISIGYAPRMLSVLTIAPYYGELLERVLDAWTMVCVGLGLWVLTGGPLAVVLACALLGWLCSFAFQRLGGRFTGPLARRLGLVTDRARHG